MNQKNRSIYLFSLMILTAFLISILYLANLKIGLILIIAAIPVSIYSIYFGIKDYRSFFLEKPEKSEEKPALVIEWSAPIRTLSPFHWTFPEFISGSTFEYFFDPEEKQATQKTIQINFEQPKWYQNIILGNYTTAQLAESLT